MRIVFVFDGLQVGGIERVGVDYIHLLLQKGYDIKVVNLVPALSEMYSQLPTDCEIFEYHFPRWVVPYKYEIAAERGPLGAFAYAGVGCVLSAFNLLMKWHARLKLRKLRNIDVAIAFSGHFNDLMFVAKNYLPTKKKMAWLHGAEFEYLILSGGYVSLYRKIKNLVCLSESCDYICQKANAMNGIKKVKIYNPTLIQNREVDTEKVADLKKKYGDFVLMVGRLASDKDQKTLILAIKHLNDTYHWKKHLVLVGDGTTRAELEAFVKAQAAEDYVHFMGQCSDTQNYYFAAHIFSHSSPMEGLPTTLIEALAYHVPIAATDSMPGAREILGNDAYGLISPVGDPIHLGENIKRLYEDENLRAEMIDKGSKRLNDFLPETVIEKLESFLHSI